MLFIQSSSNVASPRLFGADLLQRIVNGPLIKVEDLRRDTDHVGDSRQQTGSE